MTREEQKTSYAIILHNVRTYRSGGVVAVVRGKQNAELTLKNFQASQSPSTYHEGWRYFIEATDLAVGTDPQQATEMRQADLERREANVLNKESDTPSSPNSDKESDS